MLRQGRLGRFSNIVYIILLSRASLNMLASVWVGSTLMVMTMETSSHSVSKGQEENLPYIMLDVYQLLGCGCSSSEGTTEHLALSFCLGDDTLIFPGRDVIQRPLKVPFRILNS